MLAPIKDPLELGHVQQTLLIPLWARAIETKKKRPIVRDERALELMDRLDFDFGVFRRAYGTQLGCVLRGLVYDAWVGAFLERHPTGTVVELGAGLNTRFERIDNGRAQWIDVDLPDTIAMRRRYFEPTERRSLIGASVLDAEWPAQLARSVSGPCYFVSEGMLMYLRESDVQGLLSRLADAFPQSEIALDSISRSVVRHQKHHDSMKHMMDAPFQWGIDDIRGIESWDPRLRVDEISSLADIPRRFPAQVPRRYRMIGEVVRRTLPWFDASYRLSRVQLGAAD